MFLGCEAHALSGIAYVQYYDRLSFIIQGHSRGNFSALSSRKMIFNPLKFGRKDSMRVELWTILPRGYIQQRLWSMWCTGRPCSRVFDTAPIFSLSQVRVTVQSVSGGCSSPDMDKTFMSSGMSFVLSIFPVSGLSKQSWCGWN